MVEQLDHTHCAAYHNLTFLSARKRLVAEIDLMIERSNCIEVYEVKCSHRISKAQRQLYKIRKLLQRRYAKPIDLFFYCGNSKELIRVV